MVTLTQLRERLCGSEQTLWRSGFCSSSGHDASLEDRNHVFDIHPQPKSLPACLHAPILPCPGCSSATVLQSITWMLFNPRGKAKPRGICFWGVSDQVSYRLFPPLAQSGTKLLRLGSGCWLCSHRAHPSNVGCGICCSKGNEEINNRTLPTQTQGQPNTGAAFCRAPEGCPRQVVGAS